jgi:uncharacterized protein YjiS (DUF1127 family)
MSMTFDADFRLVERLSIVRERHSVPARIKSALHSVIREFGYVRASRQLHALDDRMLADLGLKRSGIEKAVRSGCAVEFDARALRARATQTH